MYSMEKTALENEKYFDFLFWFGRSMHGSHSDFLFSSEPWFLYIKRLFTILYQKDYLVLVMLSVVFYLEDMLIKQGI